MPRAAVSSRSTVSLLGNLFSRSNEFDNAYWTKDNTTVTANSTTNPVNGANDAYLFSDNASVAIHRMYGAVLNMVRNVTYCASIYVKDNTRRYFSLSEDASSGYACIFDLQNGTITSSTFDTSKYFSVDFAINAVYGQSGWYRVESVFTAKSNTAVFNAYALSSTNLITGLTYGGTGSSVYIYQAQLVRANWPGRTTITTGIAVGGGLRNIAKNRASVSSRTQII